MRVEWRPFRVGRVEVAKTRDATFAKGLQCAANIKPPKVSPIRNRKFDYNFLGVPDKTQLY